MAAIEYDVDALRRLARFPLENPNPVLRVDGGGVLDFANPAAAELLTGLGLVPGRAVAGPLADTMTAARTAGGLARVEVEVGPRVFALDVVPVAGGDVHVFGRDVTEARRVEERVTAARDAAEEANRAKSAFLANMSHELRTPLNSIIGYSELLIDDAREAPDAGLAADLEKIKSAGKHLLELINEILDFSKIEAGRMEVHCETFDLDAVVREVAATAQPLIQRRKNRLELRVGAAGRISADVTKVRQILLNLLGNAAKFTENGAIAVETRRFPRDGVERVALEVSDTGIGMSQRQLALLFQPYVQAEASTAGKFGGTGLGLTITQRFCQLMGGDVRVRSAPGEGSTFVVELPAVVADVAPVTRAPSTPRRLAAGVAPLVLTIDDEPAVLEVLARSLEAAGFSVRGATSGEEGLALARELSPSAITLDVMMPGLDGWSVLAQLKSDPDLEPIPVIVVTMVDEQRVGYALGAADYLTKPIDRDRLLRLLDAHVRGQPSRVLVVDDDAEVRGVLRRTLEREGWTVAEAPNGRVALEELEAAAPSLVVVDLMMPEMNGFELVEALRARPEAARVPIIVVTAKDLSPADRARLNGHVQSTLQKGAYDKDELLHLVRTALTEHVARRSSPPAARK